MKVEAKEDGSGLYSLGFQTTTPNGKMDQSSILAVSSGDVGLLGANGAFKMNYGESNRVNLDAKIAESGLAGAQNMTFPTTIEINGKSIEVKAEDTVRTLMDKINESDAGVQVTYQNSSDSFVFSATANGASGKIDVGGDFAKIFGEFNKTDGQDAIVTVKYAGSDQTVDSGPGFQQL